MGRWRKCCRREPSPCRSSSTSSRRSWPRVCNGRWRGTKREDRFLGDATRQVRSACPAERRMPGGRSAGSLPAQDRTASAFLQRSARISVSMNTMSKILLIEDNEMNRDMLQRRLQKRGFEVIVGVDGQDGVERARAEAPDLILLDMSLPVLDGWGAAGLLKSESSTKTIPIIALTAHAMAGERERAMNAGCDDYDIKPIELPRLLGKIEALLAR